MLTSGLRFALRIRFDLLPIQMIIRLGCPRFVAKCGLTLRWIEAGAPNPAPVNARHEFGISPANCAGATGSPCWREASCPGKAGAVRKDEGDSMKRSWTAWAVALAAIFAVAGCNDYGDRKSTRLNSSHLVISYAVFCLKKKKKTG